MGSTVKRLDSDLYGKATAYGNNCAFHCLAETLFHLPDEKLKIIAQFPAFQGICAAFKKRYKITEHVDLQFIKEFNAKIQHPYDFQLIWGPVLRDAFYTEIPKFEDLSMSIYRNEDKSWKPYQTVENDHLFKFVLALGGDLDITADSEYDRFSGSTMRELLPNSYSSTPFFWNLELELERPDKSAISGHYSFKISDKEAQTKRNNMLQSAPTDDGKPGVLIPADTKTSPLDVLSEKRHKEAFYKIVGTRQRDELLEDLVQAALTLKPIDPVILEEHQGLLQKTADTLTDKNSGKLKKEVVFNDLEQMGVIQLESKPSSRIIAAIGAILLAMLAFFRLNSEHKNDRKSKP
jgi:hypothetical protein